MSITHYKTTKVDGVSGSVDIGAAENNRLILIWMGDESEPGATFQGTFTVDGKTCTQKMVRENTAGAGTHLELHAIDESALGNSNGSVTISYSGGDAGWGFHVQVWYGVASETFYDSDDNSGTGTSATLNINVEPDYLVAMGVQNGYSGTTYSGWTSPLTERSEGAPGPDSQSMGTAGDVDSVSSTPKTYSATMSSSDRWVAMGGSFAPAAVEVDNVTSDKANGTYGQGEEIYVQVCFDEAVEVTGTPQLDLAVKVGGYKVNHVANLDVDDVITSGLEGWYDSSDLSTITEVNGAVSQWDDKSGNSRHLKQATGSAQPTTGSRTQNGLNAMDFDDAGPEWMDTDAAFTALNGGPWTMICVISPDDTGANYVCGTKQNSTDAGLHIGWRTISQWTIAHFNDDHNITDTEQADPHLHVSQYQDPGCEVWKNGTSEGSSGSTPANDLSVTTGTLQVGNGWRSTAAEAFDGLICEVILVSSAISTSDRQKLEGILAWKWGLVSDLPGGHPYKTRPPLAS